MIGPLAFLLEILVLWSRNALKLSNHRINCSAIFFFHLTALSIQYMEPMTDLWWWNWSYLKCWPFTHFTMVFISKSAFSTLYLTAGLIKKGIFWLLGNCDTFFTIRFFFLFFRYGKKYGERKKGIRDLFSTWAALLRWLWTQCVGVLTHIKIYRKKRSTFWEAGQR